MDAYNDLAAVPGEAPELFDRFVVVQKEGMHV